jgi:soluble lytic murein transglycosylase-like protein
MKSNENTEKIHKKKNKIKTYINIIKDIILIVVFLTIGFYGYEMYDNNKKELEKVQLSLLELRESISIDNQRRAKIENATNIILKYNNKISKEIAVQYAAWYVNEAEKYPNYDYKITLAIHLHESHFNKDKIGSSGELGIGQIMRYTAQSIARDLQINAYNDSMRADTKTNIMLSTKYIHDMLVDCGGNLELAIASYNGGPRTKYKQWKKGTISKEEVHPVTLQYVPMVLTNYNNFINDELKY